MPSLSKKACTICGSIFQPRSEIHEYCCTGCRVEGYRKRHSIEEPSFLNQTKKNIESSIKNVSLVDETKKPNHKISDFSAIGITEYIPNPTYVRLAKEYKDCVEHTLQLKSKQDVLKSDINRFSGVTAKIVGIIFGGLAVLATGYSFIYLQTKRGNTINKKFFYLLLVPAT